MATDFNFDRVLQNFDRLKKTMPIKIANATKNYFVKSFTDQAFDGKAWQEVQRRISGTNANKYAKPASKTRAILIQSGKLRRAVSTSLRLATFDKIEFLIDGGTIPYAKIHNDGGIIQKKEREHVLHFKQTGSNIATRNPFGKFSSSKEATYAQKVKIGAHEINIPQRKFIGDTKELRKKQVDIIAKEIDNIWK